MPLDFDRFINDYFRARPWMLEKDGSFKISSLDMDPDDPAQWRGGTMTSNENEARPPEPALHKGLRTPEEYFTEGREWLEVAEWETIENNAHDRSTNLAMLAIASALLGICAQLIQDPEDD
jgi:hypothetical protein